MNTLSKVSTVNFTKKPKGKDSSHRQGKHTRLQKAAESDLKNFYQEHWRGLCAFLRKTYGSGPPEPEDVAQDAFFQLSKMKSRAHITNPKAFLYKVSMNIALRSLKSERWLTEHLPCADEGIDSELLCYGDPDKIISSQQELKKVDQLFSSLSIKQKHIVTASRLEGKTYQQIAEETGWSVADICRQLNSALSILAGTSEH